MSQRNVLVFVYCFVDDEDFAFICLIIFLPALPPPTHTHHVHHVPEWKWLYLQCSL